MTRKQSNSGMNGSRTPWTFRVFLVVAVIAGLVVMAKTHNLVASIGTTLLVLAVPFGFILYFNRNSWF